MVGLQNGKLASVEPRPHALCGSSSSCFPTRAGPSESIEAFAAPNVDNHPVEIDSRLQALLEDTGASRVTLRRDVGGDYAFPVTNEACRPGVPSLKEERTVDLRTQPVVLELRKGAQVVQDDCRTAFDDPDFHRMLETYGGLAAQIVTPIFEASHLVAILSLHQLGEPREWIDGETEAAAQAAEDVAALL